MCSDGGVRTSCGGPPPPGERRRRRLRLERTRSKSPGAERPDDPDAERGLGERERVRGEMGSSGGE